jgi:uncharacterized membrane protein SpoIIM required for sporulation
MFHLLFLDVPAALRRDSRLFLLAIVVFSLSTLIAFIIVRFNSSSVLLVYNEQQILDFKQMFHPQWMQMGIEQSSSLQQFIFYVSNNCWLGVQLFLLGILFGVGTILFLAYTGFSLGLITGYLSSIGYQDTLWPGIITHSSFEIMATIIAAVAGMKWGFSLVLLGHGTRRHEFGTRFAQSVLLLFHAIIFFVVAALIEAFWSFAFITTAETKYVTGFISWSLLISYLIFFGRKPSPK